MSSFPKFIPAALVMREYLQGFGIRSTYSLQIIIRHMLTKNEAFDVEKILDKLSPAAVSMFWGWSNQQD